MSSVTLFEVRIPLVHPFQTSFGVQTEKAAILLKFQDDDGNCGWGETSLEENPGYCYETTTTAWYIQEKFLIPRFLELFSNDMPKIDDIHNAFKSIRGHEFAKSGLESAYWSYVSEKQKKSLASIYGGTKTEIPTGVSIGIQPSLDNLIQRISFFLDQGYQRIKIKIEPGWDYDVIKKIRSEYGDIKLMVDANSAYSLSDVHVDLMISLDRFELMMIEQPLYYQDLLLHKRLQKQIETPVCLDESIHTVSDAILAIEEECCQIINIKPGRVGGYYNAQLIAKQLPGKVWCGGMLETGVGRLHNLALQSREEFTIPGDTSGSNRYFEKDIINPQVIVNDKGYIQVPKTSNLGSQVEEDYVRKLSIRIQEFS